MKGYPALVASGDRLEVRLFRTAEEARRSHLLAVENILSRQFQKDLNFILRSYVFPEDLRPVMLFFGGEAGLKNRIIQKIREEAFRKNFRRLEELQSFIREAALKQLFETAHRIFSAAQEVLQEYRKTRSFIQEMEAARKKMGVSSSLPESLREELEKLAPENFLVIYPADFLTRLPRMVEALGLRAQRARLSAEKDRAKAAQVEPFLVEYERLSRLARKKPSPEKERLLFELRWMIEEFKISLFAPEIKTAFPVSAKRLATRIREIEARLEQD